jgi:hypothetical protein
MIGIKLSAAGGIGQKVCQKQENRELIMQNLVLKEENTEVMRC